MSAIDDMKIGKKLIGGFLIVLLILVGVAGLGYLNLQDAAARQNALYEDMLGTENLALTNVALEKMRGDIYRYIAVPADRPATSASLAAQVGIINDNMKEFRSRPLSADDKATLDQFDKAWATMQVTYKKLETDAAANDMKAVDAGLAAGSPAVTARTECLAAVRTLVTSSFTRAEDLNKATNAATATASTVMLVATFIAVIAGLGIGLYLSRSITGPVEKVSSDLHDLSEGKLGGHLNMNRKDEIGVMANAMDRCKDSIEGLIGESKMLTAAATEGKLDTRGNPDKFKGGYRDIVIGVNATLDAVIGPLNVAAEYVERISKGDIPPRITESYHGDFNEIKNNLNQCIATMNGILKEMEQMSVAHSGGDIDAVMPVDKFSGAYKAMAQGVNTMVNGHISGNTKAMAAVAAFSHGDFEAPLEQFPGKMAVINENIELLRSNLKALVTDANILSDAALAGKLSTRADASRHQGDYRRIIDGVNKTLDSVIVPVNEAMRLSEKFAQCNFNEKVDDTITVAGDFVRFKASLNNVTDEVSKVISTVNIEVMNLASNAQEATASVKEVATGAGQVARSVNLVSQNAEKGNEGIKQILRAVEDLSATVEEVTSNTESVTNLARETNKLSQSGAEVASQAELGMTSITKSTAEVDVIIRDIRVQMNKIGEIVGLITNLANQTNLLALNAAIEAARAGEAGKGFAVVASEVKSLAEESGESAENIARMISTLQEQTEKATVAMAEANKEVRSGSGALTDTLQYFNKIVKSVEQITSSMEEVAKASEAQSRNVVELTTNVQNVSNMIQSTAKEAGDAAAASEESSASIEQIASVMTNVNGIVEKVTAETAKFKV